MQRVGGLKFSDFNATVTIAHVTSFDFIPSRRAIAI